MALTDKGRQAATAQAPPPAQAQQALAPAPAERRVRIRQVSRDGVLSVAGSAAGSLALTWVLYERILSLNGALGFWVSWYVIFLLTYTAVAALQWDRRVVRDRWHLSRSAPAACSSAPWSSA